jgi:hypothetical protein
MMLASLIGRRRKHLGGIIIARTIGHMWIAKRIFSTSTREHQAEIRMLALCELADYVYRMKGAGLIDADLCAIKPGGHG